VVCDMLAAGYLGLLVIISNGVDTLKIGISPKLPVGGKNCVT